MSFMLLATMQHHAIKFCEQRHLSNPSAHGSYLLPVPCSIRFGEPIRPGIGINDPLHTTFFIYHHVGIAFVTEEGRYCFAPLVD